MSQLAGLVPRRVALDVGAQSGAFPRLQASFARVELSALLDGDTRTLLVEVDGGRRRFQPLVDGRAVALDLSWVDDGGASSCVVPKELVPRAAMVHVRATARGDLELVATDGPTIGEVVVAKVFRPGARPADWPAGLRMAVVVGPSDLGDLLGRAPVGDLRALRVGAWDDLADLAPISRCARLTSLLLVGPTRVRDLAPLAALRDLRELVVVDCASVDDLGALGELRALESLTLHACTSVRDLTPLAGLPALSYLDLGGCTALRHVAPLVDAPALFALVLFDCDAIEDAASLVDLPTLEHLFVDDPVLQEHFDRSRDAREEPEIA